MANITVVNGFIETYPEKDEFNERILTEFTYDSELMFTNIFSVPKQSYETSMIAFAGAYKSLDAYWDGWQRKFEELLSSLSCYGATVVLNDEINGLLWRYSYIKDNRKIVDGSTNWLRIKEDRSGEETEEELVL